MALTLVKTDSPDPAVVGQPLVYTITIMNLGPGNANNVVLTDVLPATVTFNSASVPCTQVGNTLTCSLGTIAAGATRVITITVTPTAPGLITNVALAEGTGQNTALDAETTLVLAPTLISVFKTDSPDPAFVGGTLTYTITVSNFGTATAENVVLTDTLPATVTFLSSSVPCTLGPGNLLTCNLGTLPPLNTATVTIQVRPNAPGTIVNAVSVVGTNTNTATDTEATLVILAADLAVTKTANAQAQVNQGLTYTVTVTNNGPSTATGVTLVDTLPANVRVVSVTPSLGVCSLVGGTLICVIGTLPPGATATVTILVVPLTPGPVTNTATVSGNEFDPNLANNTATVTTNVNQCGCGCGCC
jgi:uncharacterized repeat protein (TIGR01451 family)